MGGPNKADYGVVLGMEEDIQNQSGGVQTSQELYPNPCGKFADVGSFRDGWCAFMWAATVLFLIGLGVMNYANGEEFMWSSGDVGLTIHTKEYGTAGGVIDADGDCNTFYNVFSLNIQAICDDDYLYIGGLEYSTQQDRLSCKLDTYTALKDDMGTLKIPTSNMDFNNVYHGSIATGTGGQVTDVKVNSNQCTADHLFKAEKVAYMFSISAVASLMIGLAQLWAMRLYAREVIIFCNLLMSFVFVGLAVFCGVIGQIVGAIFFGIVGLFGFLFLCLARSRINFAAACLRMSSTVVTKYWGTIVVGMILLLIQFAICVVFVLAIGNKDGLMYGQIVGCVFILYWAVEVFGNIAHVTTSGVVSHWFFSLGGPGTPPFFQGNNASGVTLQAVKRAAIWSLGSICFGSLIVAIIQTIRFVLRMAASNKRGGIVTCLAMCLLACIEDLVRYFNDYAYVQVAMFGKPYVTAAKDTWKLVMNGTGWEALINDSLVDWVFLAFILEGGLAMGAVCYFISGKSIKWLIVGAVVAVLMLKVLMKLVYSGVMTVFIGFYHVCLSEKILLSKMLI